MKMRRRDMIRLALGAGALPSWSAAYSALAQAPQNADVIAEPTPLERGSMSDFAQAFMQQYDVPALSVAIGYGGALVYQEALGWADRESRVAVTPDDLFRIASVSKPITSVTIFKLVEDGLLQLGDKVFGPGSILGTDYGRPPYNPHVDEITVEHLLTHTCGGWSNNYADPMFMNPQMNHTELINWTLRNRSLEYPPGEHYAYSNFGYCLLGRVIEKITSEPYEDHVRNKTLKLCTIQDMSVGGNTADQRQHNEVRYYGQGEDPYSFNLARMDSHGGWIARPSDLVQFVMHVDGFADPPNILSLQSIKSMMQPSSVNAGYAHGWMVNSADNWYHNGNLPGTSTIAARIHSGFCWAAFTNTRRADSMMNADLDNLLWNMVRQVRSWQA